jgi:uncharacterized protein (TIGR03437 family)
LDAAASLVTSATYLQGTGADYPSRGPSWLATDGQGSLFVAGETTGVVFPGAYIVPQSPSGCAPSTFYVASGAYVIKLKAADWTPIYTVLLRAPCGVHPGALVVDGAGAVALALATGNGFPLHNPLVGGPACVANSSAIAKISPDGSVLEFATYLDNCGVPGIGLAKDDSLYVGVSPGQSGGPAGVLHLDTASIPAISLDQISNAFSGDTSSVVGGGLYSLTGSGFQAPTIDLGLNPSQDLPLVLGGVQVKFDGVPAAILQTSPGRVLVVPPSNLPAASRRSHDGLHNSANSRFTAVQVFSRGIPSNVVWMPISHFQAGLLTVDFPTFNTDANARNQDGTLNDADHPAAAGSTITLFATGMGATNVPVVPGSIAQSDTVTPVTPVYASWRRGFDSLLNPVPEIVSSLPGFVSALFQIRIQVPASTQIFGGTTLTNGVQRVPVALLFSLFTSSRAPLASNVVAVYLK